MYTVIDFETTGFDRNADDIIQFAYLTFHKGSVIRSGILYFYKDDMSWSKEAEDVHHITQEFLRQFKDDFQKNLIKMFTILSGSNVIGFNNAKFDCPFAQVWLARQGLPGLEFRVIEDVMLAYRPIMHQPMFKLVKLTDTFKVSQQQVTSLAKVWFGNSAGDAAHDASYDVTVTAIFTLRGLKEQLISFNDGTAKERVVTDTRTQQQLIATNGEQRLLRDPNTKLISISVKEETTIHYLPSTNKQLYTAGEAQPYEIKLYTDEGRELKCVFTEKETGIYTAPYGATTLELHMTPQRDSIFMLTKTGKVQFL